MMNSRPTKKHDGGRGPFRGLHRFVARMLESRTFLMSMALLLSLATWSIMVASDGTLTRPKTFTNVPVTVTGENTLKSRGYIVMDDIRELVPGIRMTVDVAQRNYSRVTSGSFNPHVDISQVSGEGENELNISFSSSVYGSVTACEPSSVTVNVERYITRRVPVVVQTTGEAPQGTYLDATRTDPTMLSVSGPQSVVMRVARASVTLDVGGLSAERMSDKLALEVTLQDAAGEAIESDKIEITNQTVYTDTVVVETDLVPAKSVPLMAGDLITGEPAEGYEVTKVEVSPAEMTVAAKSEVIEAIEFISTDSPMDIEGATQDVAGTVRIRKPSGLENSLPNEVSVTAKIEEKTIERTFRSVGIELHGLPETMSAELSSTKTNVLTEGGYGFINGLKKDDIQLFVNVDGLGVGEHTLPVQIRIDNAQPFTCALDTPQIKVTLTEKK